MAKKGKKGGLFTNPARKVKGLVKFVFWLACLCSVAYGVYSLVIGVRGGADAVNLIVEAVLSIICIPVVLYIAALGIICVLDMAAAVREIADKMPDGKED